MKKLRNKILNAAKAIPEGVPFGYGDIGVGGKEFGAASQVLSRLVRNGEIERVSPGIFFRARRTLLGKGGVSQELLIRKYLFPNGKRRAYVTGVALYNRLGLTTQVPSIIQIGSLDRRIYTRIGSLRLMPVKSYVEVTEKNFSLLEILDVIKDFKNIPDIEPRLAVKFLKSKLRQLQAAEVSNLVKIALKYPPRVRAMLGALLSIEKPEIEIGRLRASLHPLSKYDFGLGDADLTNADDWKLS